MKKHLDIKIYGEVQGVFFRARAKEKADGLGLFGFARNEENGSVYMEVEGEEESLKKFLDWCNRGSEFASVKKLDYKFINELKDFKEFEMK